MNTHRKPASSLRWILSMAWRDSRGKRWLLLLFTSSVVFGIGAIVAIHSLRENLGRIVEEQARSLLGADAVFQTRTEPSAKVRRFLRQLPGEVVSEQRFRSMVLFPEAGESRFIQVRAVDDPLPFYGQMETLPQLGEGGRILPAEGTAIVEESLVLQMGLKPGDTLRLGEADFILAAALVRMAGESEVTGFFAPRIYINQADLPRTQLIQEGSIVRYRTHVGVDTEDLAQLKGMILENRGLFAEEGVRAETVADRRASVEAILNNLLDFLNLIGFIALLLGGVGIVGAVNVYIQGKRETIAILRCLGASSKAAFAIYLGQMMGFGLLGALIGTGFGVAIQFVIPQLLQGFLPFPVEMQTSWVSIATGLSFGWLIVTASALMPLLGIRRISPLRALRAGIEPAGRALKDPLVWLIGAILLGTLLLFSLAPAREPLVAAALVGGLALSLAVLALFSWALRAGLKRLPLGGTPYAYRLAFGNLYRPNNRTLLLMVTLGMGVLLVHTLLLVRDGLLGQVDVEEAADAANVILLDVQPDQRDAVVAFLDERGHPPHDVLPVITMRVEKIKGKPLRDWREMENSPVDDWVYTWEFRNTYRDHVLDNAEVVDGTFVARHEGGEPYPISLSANVLDDFDVTVGDSLTWNVQGVPVETVVSSVRDVRWQAGRQNFNIVFPLNTIEPAPTVYAISVRMEDRLATAQLQGALTREFPNVSLIDLSLVFQTVRDILDKATFVIKFMAGFTVATGLFVLAGAVLGSRYQRMRESVLFRTLGASSSFIRKVLTFEFILLGFLAGLTGLALSTLASWALLHFAFEVDFAFSLAQAGVLLTGVVFLTWLTGWSTSRGIATQPPLVVLRKE